VLYPSQGFTSEDQHRITKAVEAVAEANCFLVCPANEACLGKSGDHHKEGGTHHGSMECP